MTRSARALAGTVLLLWTGVARGDVFYNGPFNVTTDGTGTRGFDAGGPIANATTSYTATFASPYLTGSGTFTLGTGGSITNGGSSGSGLLSVGNATVNLTGGTIAQTLIQSGADAVSVAGSLNVSGGSIRSTGDASAAVRLGTGATYVQTGGVVSGFGRDTAVAADNATLTLAGGAFAGGFADLFDANNTAALIDGGSGVVLNIYGTGFRNLFGQDLVPGQSYPITRGSNFSLNQIEGQLLYGGQTVSVIPNFTGVINYNVGSPPAVPEPTVLVPAAAGLGLVRRRRRTAR